MKVTDVKLYGRNFTVHSNKDGSFSLLRGTIIILTIVPKLDKNYFFNWSTIDGRKGRLVDRIGFLIETQNMKF
jgi:hypothetical protein